MSVCCVFYISVEFVFVFVVVNVVRVGSVCNSSDTCGLLTMTETKRGNVGM